MRRRRNKNNPFVIAAMSALVIAGMGGLGYMAYQSHDKPVADKLGCFNGLPQTHTAVIVDASFPRFNDSQKRSFRHYIQKLYNDLEFNEELSVYTTEGDQVSSVMSPRFNVCGQAKTPDQLTAINAEAASTGYLQKQRQRLFDKVLAPELDQLLADNPEAGRQQNQQSPMLEMLANLSRSSSIKPGSKIVLVSDLIQNSESAQFCFVKGDMPPFSAFKKRPVYQGRLKPESFQGVEIDILMLQRPAYGPYCNGEDEIRRFWVSYFKSNGVKSQQLIRLR